MVILPGGGVIKAYLRIHISSTKPGAWLFEDKSNIASLYSIGKDCSPDGLQPLILFRGSIGNKYLMENNLNLSSCTRKYIHKSS